MFIAIQLIVMILVTVFDSYSMDTQTRELCNIDWENSFAQSIIGKQISTVPFPCSDIKKRVSAMRRIYATSERGDVYLHKGIINGYLRSSEGDRFAQIDGKFAIVWQVNKSKSWSMSGVEMRSLIKSMAFNADGSVFALVSDREIAVCDLFNSKVDEALKLRLKKFLNKDQYVARHVALSDSGNKMAVGVAGLGDLRIVVIDTYTKQELYNLAGNPVNGNFRFFYMTGENIIAMCFSQKNMQYDLGAANVILKKLTEEQKSFLSNLYRHYSDTQMLLSLSLQDRDWLSYTSLPNAIKSWACQFLWLVD